MPFTEANMEQEAKELQEMMDASPEVKAHIEAFNAEYELRKKMVLARKESGLTQQEVGLRAGLDYRAISRAETNSEVSPNLRTLIKYLNAIGCELEIVRKIAN